MVATKVNLLLSIKFCVYHTNNSYHLGTVSGADQIMWVLYTCTVYKIKEGKPILGRTLNPHFKQPVSVENRKAVWPILLQ